MNTTLRRTWTIAIALSLVVSASLARGAHSLAQYPQRPIRMLVPFPPGGTTDILARLIAARLNANLGQQVIVDNRGGGGGNIAAQTLAKSAADGYTLMTTLSNIVTNPAVNPTVDYDPVRDFTPILLFGRAPYRLVVNPKVAASSVQEWYALAKARPGSLNYGSAGSGTAQHLSVELFKRQAGINIVHIPYKGAGPAMTDLIGGQIHMMFAGMVSSRPHVKAGRLRALAVTGSTRNPESPELPTIAETVLPGYEATEWFGVVAPRGMSKPLLVRVHGIVANAVQSPEIRERLLGDGMNLSTGTPELFGKVIRDDFAKWRQLVKETGITAD
jgi:tripartite-type tricarboxylate transporter receptor subunit TctC